jgi:tetratricopeptide (TPR) repeat protein
LYKRAHRYEESEALYKRAIVIYEKLAAENPAAYEVDLASSRNALAELYNYNCRYAESEVLYKEAMAAYEKLAAENPEVYEVELAWVNANLAGLYDEEPSAYEADLEWAGDNLAAEHYRINRYRRAEALYKKIAAIYEKWALEYPSVCEADLERFRYTLTGLNNMIRLLAESELEAELLHKRAPGKAPAIRKKPTEEGASADKADLASSLRSKGLTCKEMGRMDEAAGYLRQALALREELAARDMAGREDAPDDLFYDLADSLYDLDDSLYDLVCVLRDMGKYEEAEPLCLRQIALRNRLTAGKPKDVGRKKPAGGAV